MARHVVGVHRSLAFDALHVGDVDRREGTSTGALQACALAHGLPAAEITRLYREEGPKIFPGRASRLWSRLARLPTQGPSAPKYDGKGLDRTLKRTFADTRFGDLPHRVLAVTYDVVRRDAIFFKSWKPEHQDHLVRDVCRASASAPTYFPAHRMKVERMHRESAHANRWRRDHGDRCSSRDAEAACANRF